MIPKVYSVSKLKIRYKPEITIKPKKSSKIMSFLLKKMGSIIEVNSAPVLMATNATETLDTLMAEKKKIQCTAINTPPIKNLRSALGGTFIDFFLIIK